MRCEGAGAVVINIAGTTTRSMEWQVAIILRFSAFGTPPLIPKATLTAISLPASPFAIGNRQIIAGIERPRLSAAAACLARPGKPP